MQHSSLVMYEHSGSALLGVITATKKGKFLVFNERSRSTELAGNRLHLLPGSLPGRCSTDGDKATYLQELRAKCIAQSGDIDVAELWSVVVEEDKEFSVSELTELYFGDDTLEQHVALRIALLEDGLHFRRKKEAFSPRPVETVEELKKGAETKRLREEKLNKVIDLLADAIAQHKKGEDIDLREVNPELVDVIDLLEMAAAGSQAIDHAKGKEVSGILERCAEKSGISLHGGREAQAYNLLRATGHFHKYTNMAVLRHQVPTTFTEEVLAEAKELVTTSAEYCENAGDYRVDLTHLDAFTIDDVSTKDMDDAISLTPAGDGYELGIHITDVAALLKPDTALDKSAYNRATSLYLNDHVVNMLPRELSEAAFSLVADKTRPAISVLADVDAELNVSNPRVVASLIKVRTRYSYDEVDDLLEHEDKYLSLLYNIACAREAQRMIQGGFKIHRKEIYINLEDDGSLSLKDVSDSSPARNTIGEMMIYANEVMASFARDNEIPFLFRSQPPREEGTPGNVDHIPEGPAREFAERQGLQPSSVSLEAAPHSTLGLPVYTQATSPIRRYIDLLHQRQLLGFLAEGKPHYNSEELLERWHGMEQTGSRANQVSRETRRFWSLAYLKQRSKENSTIGATVIRTDGKIPLVELDELHMTIPCKLGNKNKAGDRLELLLKRINPALDELRIDVVGKEK